ncbi:hypothetical protein CsSME_00024047 [Camellia sinensis var. sinensis]
MRLSVPWKMHSAQYVWESTKRRKYCESCPNAATISTSLASMYG